MPSGEALIPVYAGRPPVLRIAGAWVYVSVHDQAHLNERARRRAAVALLHPDAPGGTERKFIVARAAYERWLAHELRWYASLGLAPPKDAATVAVANEPDPHSTRTSSVRCARCGLPRLARQRRYCSAECERAARLARQPTVTARTCAWCRRGNVPVRYGSRYCSRGCRRLATALLKDRLWREARARGRGGTRRGDRTDPELVAETLACRRAS